MEPFYPNDKDLEIACNDYFATCDVGETVQIVRRGEAVDVKKAIPYTVPGLALHLGYANRHSIHDLKQDPLHSATIKRALSSIENQRVAKALNGEQDSRFAQFDLKNNFGYKDTQEVTNVNINITLTDKEIDQRLAQLDNKARRVEGIKPAALIEHDTRRKSLI